MADLLEDSKGAFFGRSLSLLEKATQSFRRDQDPPNLVGVGKPIPVLDHHCIWGGKVRDQKLDSRR
jgi:hypothetical protein